MPNLNRVTLAGHLGKDPDLRHTPGGQAVVNFSLATSEKWVDKGTGQPKEKTEWHKVVVWGKPAEYCSQYLKKGSAVFVEGKLQTREWQDKEGQKRYTTEIVASSVHGLNGSRKESSGEGVQMVKDILGAQEERLPFD